MSGQKMMMDRRIFSAGLTTAFLGGRAMAATPPQTPFLLGADVSWIPQDEAQGATYFENGVQKDPLDILQGAGFNAIKLRLFVNPENGYSARDPEAGWCGLEQTIKFARRIRARGMHLSLTFHYSDTWADPQKQTVPAAWEGLSLAQLCDAVHAHTHDSLKAMAEAGVSPDLVLVGNETTFGMLWPQGRVPLTLPTGNPQTDETHMKVEGAGGFDAFAALLKAGLAGVREAAPKAQAAVHNHLGRHWPIVENWTNALLQRGVAFDAVGFSCYQQEAEGDWERTFANFGKQFPDQRFFIAEYSSRKRYVNEIARKYGALGTYIWEPTRHQEAVFDQDGHNAGEGPKPNLLSQGINSAEAPGAAISAGATPVPAAAPRPRNHGGRYDANALLGEYRQLSREFGLS